jgi:DNA-binding CsgD family transcriptional regulator
VSLPDIESLRDVDGVQPSELRRCAIDLVCQRAEAGVGAWYIAANDGGVQKPTEWLTTGDRVAATSSAMARRRTIASSARDLSRPKPAWTRAFYSWRSFLTEQQWFASEDYRVVFHPVGLIDQLGLLVYSGPRFVGWIGALRSAHEGYFSRADRRRLLPIVDAVSSALVSADAIDRAAVPEEGADLLLRPDGHVEFASMKARGWLGRPGARAWLRDLCKKLDRPAPPAMPRWRDGAEIRWSRLSGRRGVRFLVHLAPGVPVERVPCRLTEAQLAVAALAAKGLSTTEIARLEGRSIETVRSHLREAYRRLDIGSRAELALALADRSQA